MKMHKKTYIFVIFLIFLSFKLLMFMWKNQDGQLNGEFNALSHHAEVNRGGESATDETKYLLGYTDIRKPEFIRYLWREWISYPSDKPIKLSKPSIPINRDFSERRQSLIVDKLLGHRRNGTFIECGALDGEFYSTTLYLERQRGWKGLLIEANNKHYSKLKNKNRNAYTVNACVSPSNDTRKVDFAVNMPVFGHGGISDLMKYDLIKYVNRKNLTQKVQCLPLISLIDAVNFTHIDYFSLDVEGAEVKILKTIPFQEIKIDVLTVEYFIKGNMKATENKLQTLSAFFRNTRLYREPHVINGLDVVFIRKDVMTQKEFDAYFTDFTPKKLFRAKSNVKLRGSLASNKPK